MGQLGTYRRVINSETPAVRLGMMTTFAEPAAFLAGRVSAAGVPGGVVVAPWNG